MKDIINLYWSLRTISERYGNKAGEFSGVVQQEDIASFFAMAFNNLTITLELLDYYHSLWEKLNPQEFSNPEETRDQNGQRVILIQKMCFIELMSAFEFAAKKIVLKNVHLFGDFKGRIYLTRIMQRSTEIEVLNKEKLLLWKGASILRNTLVHNNGIADKNEVFKYPEVTLILTKDNMTKGNYTLFGLMSKWLLHEAFCWLKNVNKQIHP